MIHFGDDRLPERFWDKVSPEPNTGCWLWTAADQGGGYGSFYFQGKVQLAHRVSYATLVAVIPKDLMVDHKCRTRFCVNPDPDHLEPVTNKENTLRGLRGRLIVECANGHTFTEESTGRTSDGRRFCLFCRRKRDRGRRDAAFWREYRAKRKARGK